ncbi:MAG: amino acid permease, partial [Armatimonadota bacterium]|nr:amino acid permease [Armatimonadota bacterium]
MPVNVRRLLLGKPLASHALEDETLPKILALPIFSSDALSSVAYATQEMMIALVVAGSMAFSVCIWQAAAIVSLLVILTISYNQTISAYPQGGGAYNVAHDNLGVLAAQVAAVSLMTDYMLTVAVSVASGIDAIISTSPLLQGHLIIRLLLCLLSVWFIVLMNLRGITESGRAFAVPVYV